MGDSFVWGASVDQQNTMPLLLEKRLRDGGGRKVEVLNFGMGGYGTDQEWLLYREVVRRYVPDLVLLAFFYSNDFWNNCEEVSSRRAKPYFIPVGAEGLELRNVPVPPPESRDGVPAESKARWSLRNQLSKRTVLFPLVVQGVRAAPLIGPFLKRLGILASDEEAFAEKAAAIRLREKRREVTRRLLRAFQREVEADGAQFLVVVFPGYGYFDGRADELRETMELFSADLPTLPVHNLAPVFDRVGRGAYGIFGEHWTPLGSQIAADEVARYLSREGRRFLEQPQ